MRQVLKAIAFLTVPNLVAAEDAKTCKSNASSAYIPNHVIIVPPASDVPVPLARWSGAYTGHFEIPGGVLCTRLFVRTVAADGSAEVTYVHGEHPTFPASDTDERGTIEPDTGELRFTLGNGRRNTYSMQNDANSVWMTSEQSGRKVSGELIKVER